MPDVEIIPESKYRESYMKLLNSQEKPFNKAKNDGEFHESLNITGMQKKKFQGKHDLIRSSKYSHPSTLLSKKSITSKPLTPDLKSNESVQIISNSPREIDE